MCTPSRTNEGINGRLSYSSFIMGDYPHIITVIELKDRTPGTYMWRISPHFLAWWRVSYTGLFSIVNLVYYKI